MSEAHRARLTGPTRFAGISSFAGSFVDEHVSVRWDDPAGVRWRDAADVLWLGATLPSRADALAWCRAVASRHPGALVVCAGYAPARPGGTVGRCVAVRPGAPPLTACVRADVCPHRAPALVGSLVHAWAAARA